MLFSYVTKQPFPWWGSMRICSIVGAVNAIRSNSMPRTKVMSATIYICNHESVCG
ncbi:uncharacterized protein B0H18DRAFT_1006171 [Fomitopsis serialis]|uniref:uncharacterized protein n=1 Tax=Fomitopsis serialis TaxID=139415 RepID=UPI0020077698|nr:uncharacterized protein B0H18DRAFT_1006171 [Neoantrodia serialis]KAH9926456.1 hypothetical protein B0H18DRAFT_1006171 [Neoantrodia serialis]